MILRYGLRVVAPVLSVTLVHATAMSVFAAAPRTGSWRAWLDSPGGELPFGMELDQQQGRWRAYIINGDERIEVPRVTWDGHELVLDIDYYDSKITAKPSADGSILDGQWKKRGRKDRWTQMPFHAKVGKARRFGRAAGPGTVPSGHGVDGRWDVRFSKSEDAAVAVFDRQSRDTITGTFLTLGGDYGFLSGSLDGDRLRLAGFDGAHAFLFDARIQQDATLKGDFWSGDAWHETWTAQRNPDASLPDGFGRSKWTGDKQLSSLVFPDLEGKPRSLNDPAFRGRARIIEAFGSWCPNCHDASRYLVELQQRYGERGLKVLGLAFELSGDFKRDAGQVRKYAARHGVTYPLLVAGTPDKEKVAAALPGLDRLRAFPTTIFLNAKGQVHAVHSGFSGPATGDAYQKLRAKYEAVIEELLADKLPP
ncbi:MAG: TlpA family protein disulfide reductase [Phycisphaerales bacterium]|nr:MAG: TlpA family protein disulfide reductase [Phycisphaerales bacterium]